MAAKKLVRDLVLLGHPLRLHLSSQPQASSSRLRLITAGGHPCNRRYSVFNKFSEKVKGEVSSNPEFQKSVKQLKEKAEQLQGVKEELKVRIKQTTEQLYKHVDGVWTEAKATAKQFVEDVRERWETSDNPVLHEIEYLNGTIFQETDAAASTKEIHWRDPSFSLPELVAEVQEVVKPVLNAYIKGDVETLKKYCSSEIIERCNAEHSAYKNHGIFLDNKFVENMRERWLKQLKEKAEELKATQVSASVKQKISSATEEELPAWQMANIAFVEAWKMVAPSIAMPTHNLPFATQNVASPLRSKLTVNLVLPYASDLSHKQVDMIKLPATTGQLDVCPGHVPAFVELKPGLMLVYDGNDVTKYFVSGGFAVIYVDSYAEIIAVEAVLTDRIDASLVQKGLVKFTEKLNSASTDLEKAEAQIGVDVHSALNSALTGGASNLRAVLFWSFSALLFFCFMCLI